MEFVSVFDEAGRDAEAEAVERAHTAATQEATQACWPFLALARSEGEFSHRLALVEDRLTSIASAHGVSYESLVEPMIKGFQATHKEAGTGPKVAEGDSKTAASGMKCANCGHSNDPHSKGGTCECGCQSFQPQAKTAAGEGSYARNPQGNPDFGWVDQKKMSPDEAEKQRLFPEGIPLRGELTPEQEAWLKKRSSFDQRIAQIHQAIMEGENILEWVEQNPVPPAPSRHNEEEEFENENASALSRAEGTRKESSEKSQGWLAGYEHGHENARRRRGNEYPGNPYLHGSDHYEGWRTGWAHGKEGLDPQYPKPEEPDEREMLEHGLYPDEDPNLIMGASRRPDPFV